MVKLEFWGKNLWWMLVVSADLLFYPCVLANLASFCLLSVLLLLHCTFFVLFSCSRSMSMKQLEKMDARMERMEAHQDRRNKL